MKKHLFAAVFVLIAIFLLPIISNASQDITSNDSQTEPTSGLSDNSDLITRLRQSCFCGRDYHTEDSNVNSAYDCVKCGKNMYVCSCNCWCGAKSVLDISGNYGSVTPLICTGCDKPCLLCDCRTDREAILRVEEQRRTGEISSLNLLRPHNAFSVIVSVFIVSVFISLICVFSVKSKNALTSKDGLSKNRTAAEISTKENDKNISQNKDTSDKSIQNSETDFSEKEPFELFRIALKAFENIKDKESILSDELTDIHLISPPVFTISPNYASIFVKILEHLGTPPEKLTLSELSPLAIDDSETEKAFASLRSRGLILTENGGLSIKEPLGGYILDLISPEKAFDLTSLCKDALFTVCKGENAWYLTEFENVWVFETLQELSDFLSEIFPNPQISDFAGADIALGFDEFCFFIMCIAFSIHEKPDCEEICDLISKKLQKSGFLAASSALSGFSDENISKNLCKTLYEKGLMIKNGESYDFSPFSDNILNIADVENCIIAENYEKNTADMLFAIKNNGVSIICKTENTVRIIAAKTVPWNNYFGRN